MQINPICELDNNINIPTKINFKTNKAQKNAEKIKKLKESTELTLTNNEKINYSQHNNIVSINDDALFDDIANNEFNKINIHFTHRNSRKYITTIENIHPKYFQNQDKTNIFLTKIKTIMSSRATLKYTNDKYIIELSGNNISKIISLLCDFCQCEESDIIIHGVSS